MVEITHPVSMTFPLPSDFEFKKLFEIVGPSIGCTATVRDRWPESARAESEKQFREGFFAIGNCLRVLEQPEVKRAHSTSYWCNECENFLRSAGRRNPEIGAGSFALAALALGVPHTVEPGRWPYDCFWGLGFGGMPFSDAAWRRVLASGQVRPASPNPNQYAAPSPAEVRYGF